MKKNKKCYYILFNNLLEKKLKIHRNDLHTIYTMNIYILWIYLTHLMNGFCLNPWILWKPVIIIHLIMEIHCATNKFLCHLVTIYAFFSVFSSISTAKMHIDLLYTFTIYFLNLYKNRWCGFTLMKHLCLAR